MNSITYLSNAGVVLTLGGVPVMVDGLYNAEGLPFSNVPEGLLDAAAPQFLAFTHTHHDHLDQRKLEAYLSAHPVRGLLLPPRVRGERHGVPETVMKGTGGTVHWPGLTVDWARTPHLDRARPEHHSLLCSGGGAAVLLAGDAMPSAELARLAAGARIDAALVTPPLLQSEEGRALLDAIAPGRVLIYHLPRSEDDAYGLRTMAARQAVRWGARYPITALLTPGEDIPLS